MRNEPEFLQPLLFQPQERATAFSFSEVLHEARAIWFPELEVEVEARIEAFGPLAGVWFHRMGRDRHIVVFHPALNRPGVPIEVVRFIAKHELAHIAVPLAGHPPAFWEKEREVGPERAAVLAWIHADLGRAFVSNAHGLWVRRDWARRLRREATPYMPHLPLYDRDFSELCPGGGAQLRFAPTWSAAPAPFAVA